MRWGVLIGSPLAGLAVALAVGLMWLGHDELPPAEKQPLAASQAEEPEQPAAKSQAAEKPPAAEVSARPDWRWLPDQARLVLSIRAAQLAREPEARRLVQWAGAWWEAPAGAILRGLDLRPERVRWITWASTDLAAWAQHGVAIV